MGTSSWCVTMGYMRTIWDSVSIMYIFSCHHRFIFVTGYTIFFLSIIFFVPTVFFLFYVRKKWWVVKNFLPFLYFLNRTSFHLAFTEVQYLFSGSPLMLIKKPKILESFAKHHDAYNK